MSTQDKLAEALRNARSFVLYFGDEPARACIAEIDAALQAHAAEAAQAQAQSGEWVQKAIVDAKGDIEYVHVRIFNAMKARAEEAEAMLAAAPQAQAQAAEPVAWTRQDVISDGGGCPIGMDEPRIAWGAECPDYAGGWAPLYTHPQPAQDAKDAARYRWLRDHWHNLCTATGIDTLGKYCVTEIFLEPAEHAPFADGTLEAAIDAAMAKESGNGR